MNKPIPHFVLCFLLLTALVTSPPCFAGTVTSYKGFGSLDGQRFLSPQGITVDANGLIVVSDTYNHALKAFTEDGKSVFTVGTNGAGVGQFSSPQGVARDGQGNLWVADTGNDRLQEFDQEGNFVNAVGSYGTVMSNLYGTINEYRFYRPFDIKVGPDGNYWIADAGKHRIVVLDQGGKQVRMIQKSVANVTSGNADGQFNEASGLDFDGDGNLWVADTKNHRLQKFDQDGNFLTTFGGSGYTGAAATSLNYPRAVCPTPDGVLVSFGNRVIKFTLAGLPLFTLGNPDGSIGSGDNQFNQATGIAVDGSGTIFVADYGNHRIQMFTPEGVFSGAFGGYAGGASQSASVFDPGDIYYPIDLAFDSSGYLWVLTAGYANKKAVVQQFDTTTYDYIQGFDGSSDITAGVLSSPQNMTIATDGHLWVTESSNNRVREFQTDGTHVRTIGSLTLDGQTVSLATPKGIAINGNTLWVADSSANRLLAVDLADTDTSAHAFAGFSFPWGLALDSGGDLWIGAYGNKRVVQMSANGLIKRAFSETESQGTAFSSPNAVTADGSGGIWVSDTGNHRLLRYDANGTLLGKIGGYNSGMVSAPRKIAVAADGSLWVADYGGAAIWHFSAAGACVGKIDNTSQSGVTLNTPSGVALYHDQAQPANEFVLVTDWNQHQLLKFSSAGAFIGQLAESGPGSSLNQLKNPAAVTVSNQELLVADYYNNRIKVLSPDGVYKRVYVTDGTDGEKFDAPAAVAFNAKDNTLWVADSGNDRLQVLNQDGTFVRFVGGPDNGLFKGPNDLYADADGHLWFTDSYSSQVIEVDGEGNLIQTIGSQQSGALFSQPAAVLGVPDGSFWVADSNNHQLEHLSDAGTLIAMVGGVQGSNDGQFQNPQGMALSVDGATLYVADTENDRIQQYSADGLFQQQIGMSGIGLGALDAPAGMAVDDQGQLWVVERGNQRVQVFAANGDAQFTKGSYKLFNNPFAIAVDKQGKVWITDTGNHRVLKFENDDSATPLLSIGKAGNLDGTGAGEFSSPMGIAVDSEGHIHVVDNSWSNSRIQVFAADGTFLRAYGGELYNPAGISISNGRVFVADIGKNQVAVFSENGLPVATMSDNGTADGGLSAPQGLAKDSAGNLWVADFGNDRVVQLDTDGKVVRKLTHLIDGPDGLVIDAADNLWVSSRYKNLVLKFSATGALLKAFDNAGAAFDTINDPSSMVFFQDNLYVVDQANHRVVVLDSSGATVRTFGAQGSGAGLLDHPWGIAVGPDNTIWVSQTYSDSITVFTPGGDFVKTFGSEGNAPGMLGDPHGLAFGIDGALWVVNTGSHRLDRFSPAGSYLSSAGSSGSGPGQLNGPQGLAIDSLGRLFVADTANQRIVVFDKEGAYLFSFADAVVNSPRSLAIDQKGLLWVIDQKSFWGGATQKVFLAFDLAGHLVFSGGAIGGGAGMVQTPSAVGIDSGGRLWVGDTGLDILQAYDFNQPQDLVLQLVHRHWRFGSEAEHLVDMPLGATLPMRIEGSVLLGETSGSGDVQAILDTTWLSTDPEVATVDALGVITAKAVGQAEITGTIDGQTLSLTVNVVADDTLPVMVLGKEGDGLGEYVSPGPVWTGNGKVYVADSNNRRITILDLKGNWLKTITEPEYLSNIGGLVVDQNGVMYVSDVGKDQVHKFDANGAYMMSIGDYGQEAGQLNSPQGLALDKDGNLWVVDTSNSRLQKFSPQGEPLGGFGSNGWGVDELFSYPTDVAIDEAGNVWVADSYHLKKFTPDGVFLSKVADVFPQRLWLEQSGTIWVLSSDGHIRKVGKEQELLMDYDAAPFEDEPGRFNNPDGIAVDGAGNLWVADAGNHRLQRIRFIPKQLTLLADKAVIKDQDTVTAIAFHGVTDSVSPGEIVNTQAQWSVEEPAIATVEAGVVTALETGLLQVTAQFQGLSDTLSINLLAFYAVEQAGNVNKDNAEPIPPGKAIEGSFGSSYYNDAHWYSISPANDGYYHILFSSAMKQANTTLDILGSDEKLIHTIDVPASGLALPIYLTGQTTYYLRVHGNQKDDFLLGYLFAAAGTPDTVAASLAVNPGDTVNGQVAIASSRYHKLVLNGPQQLILSYANTGSVTDMQITIYPEEVSEETILDQETSYHGEAKQIAIGLNQGTYYIEMKAAGNCDDSIYTLSVAPNLEVVTGEYEGNNTLAFANSLTDGVTLTARNYSSQDVDLYTFHYAPSDAQDYLTFNFSRGSTQGSHTIRLLNVEGSALQTYTASSDQDIIDQKMNMKGGQYFLEVRESNSTRIEYQLTLAAKTSKISAVKKVTGVELIPAKAIADIQVGDTVAITAKVYYSDGTVVENPDEASWIGTNAEVISVNNGQVTVDKAGSGSVVVSYEGKVGTLDLSVGVIKKQSFGNLIIVAGGGIGSGNKLKDITQYLSDLTYQKFKGRGFGDNDIFYFNPESFKDLDGNGFNDGIVDKTEITTVGFLAAITQWAAAYPSSGPLYIYLNDHGADALFQLYPNQILSATVLKEALDQFQADSGRAVVVIIEACHSGTFVAPLMDGSNNRVVITSADQGLAFLGDGGSASFSQFFMGSLYKGASLSQAYDEANNALMELGSPYATMSPQVAPASLVTTAQDFYVVGNFALAPMFPEITAVTLAPTYDAGISSSYAIQAQVTGVDNGKVWATIKPVNYTPPVVTGEFATPEIQLPMVEMVDADADGITDGVFDGAYAGLTVNGVYDVVIFARDGEGNITQTPVHTLTVKGGEKQTTTTTTTATTTTTVSATTTTVGATTTTTIPESSTAFLNVGSGWSLLSSSIMLLPGELFADAGKFVSVWKWEGGTWSVYLAGETTPGAYAASKGFTNLVSVNPGEGFWLNSVSSQQLAITGTPQYGPLAFSPGWNLVGLKNTQASPVSELISGESGIASVWKWQGGTWAVFLPEEQEPGAYAASKGFSVLTTINPGEGFWVNKQ